MQSWVGGGMLKGKMALSISIGVSSYSDWIDDVIFDDIFPG